MSINLLFKVISTCFGRCFRPSSGALDCIYSIWQCAPAAAGSNLGEHYQILQIQSSAPDDGQKLRPKHVEMTWNNKLNLKTLN